MLRIFKGNFGIFMGGLIGIYEGRFWGWGFYGKVREIGTRL